MISGSRRIASLAALAMLISVPLSGGAAIAASQASASTASPVTAALAASAPSAEVGSPLELTATVTGSAPTGTVAFLDDGTPLSCGGTSGVALASGAAQTATCSIAKLPAPSGTQSLTAVYLGDANNLPASASLDEPVTGAPTATTLSVPTVATGTPVTYTASVTAGGSPVSAGQVAFTDGGSPIGGCSPATVSSGSARCTVASGYASAGTHDIEAAFTGTGGLAPSSSAASEEVGTAASGTATTTSLTASASHPVTGGPLSLGAVVSAGSASSPPKGTVTFTDGGAALANCVDLPLHAASGTSEAGATCTVSTGLAVGPHDLAALYRPASSTFAPSTASAVVHVAATTAAVTVTASPDEAPGGSPVTLAVSATGDAAQAPATGQVQLDVSGEPARCATASGGLVTLSSGSATCTLNDPAAGQTVVTATYLGNHDLQPAMAAAPLTVAEPLAPTNVVVTSGDNPLATSTAVKYTATVSGGSSPTGQVTFRSNGSDIGNCIAVPLTSGTATCKVSAGYAKAAVVVISAVYSGDSTHLPGAGSLSQVVQNSGSSPAAPTFQLSGPEGSVKAGTAVTYKATATGSSAAPTGDVTFSDDGSAISGCISMPLTQIGTGATSQATCSSNSGSSPDRNHTVTASYPGDANDRAASAALELVVAKALPLLSSFMQPEPMLLTFRTSGALYPPPSCSSR